MRVTAYRSGRNTKGTAGIEGRRTEGGEVRGGGGGREVYAGRGYFTGSPALVVSSGLEVEEFIRAFMHERALRKWIRTDL